MQIRILIIDEDSSACELLAFYLKTMNWMLDIAFDGASGEQLLRSQAYDLVILDLTLPDFDGLEFCRRVRARVDETPLLIVSASTGAAERVMGLEMGADDYLSKPYDMVELLARIKALMRRSGKLSAGRTSLLGEQIQVGKLTIDINKRKVSISDRIVELTVKEFDLLTQFARNPGRVYTRSQLLDLVWGYKNSSYEHTINCHVNRLRKKIEYNQSKPEIILTVWGVGYKLNDQLSC